MSEPSDVPVPTDLGGSAAHPAAHGVQGGEPDPLDALRAELAMIDQQPVVDRVARFEHANVVLAAALAELDEV